MEPRAFVVLLAALCVRASVSSQGNINVRVYDDGGLFTRGDIAASAFLRAHELGKRSAVSATETDGAPSLGRVAPTDGALSLGRVASGRRLPSTEKTTELSCSFRKKCSVGNNTVALDFYARNCFCDVLCHTYGDCCKDAMKPAHRQHKLTRKAFSCRRVHEVDLDVEMYLVSSCPRQFKDVWVREQCGNESTTELFYRVPVSGVTSTIVYRNYYCALCNDEADVTFWQVTLACGSGPEAGSKREGANMDASAMMRHMLQDKSADCGVQFQHSTMRARKCKSHISRCSRQWHGKKVKQKCKTGPTAYVYRGLDVYRNKHCATCNFFNASQLTCIDPRTPKCEFDCSDMGRGKSLPAFSVLLDLDLGSGLVSDNRVGVESTSRYTETVIDKRMCPDNNIYDPFSARCRPVYCGAGRVFVDGDCKPEDEQVTHALTSTTMKTTTATSKRPATTTLSLTSTDRRSRANNWNEVGATNVARSRDSATLPMDTVLPAVVTPRVALDCPRLQLNASEYEILDNSSVFVKATGEEYMRDEYTFDDDRLFICSPYRDQAYNVSRNVTHIVIMFKFDRLQKLVSIIGLLISITALAIQFIVYMVLPVLRNIPGRCVLSLIASLFVAQLLYLVGTVYTPEIHEVCVSLAAAMHYAFLAAFFWMNVMAIDICRTFSSSRVMLPTDPHSARFVFYSLYAWLTPAMIVGGSLALDLLDFEATAFYRPHYGDGICWITRRWSLLVTFALPLALILVVNFVLFGITVKNLCLISIDTKRVRGDDRNQFGLYVKLSTIMGLTWVFGFVSSLVELPVLWYAFIVFNTLQGAFICFAFACNKKVFRLLHERGRTHRATIGSGQNGKYYSSSTLKSGFTRPTYLSEGEALVISQETCI